MRKRIFAVILLCAACVFSLAGCGYSRHKVKDKNALETEAFLDKPDSMVVICGGSEKTVSREDLDKVQDAFWDLMGCYEGYAIPLKGYNSNRARNKFVNDCKDKYTCVEYRYNRRRKFTGLLQSARYDCEYFTGRQFDAMLLVCEENAVVALPYLNGKYAFTSPCYLYFSGGALSEFTALLETYI